MLKQIIIINYAFCSFQKFCSQLMEKGISKEKLLAINSTDRNFKIIYLGDNYYTALTPTINESINKTEKNICLPCFTFNLINYLLEKMILDITRTNSFKKMFHLWFVECRLRICLLDNCWCSDPRNLDPGCESLPRRPQWNTWEQNWFKTKLI